MGGGRETNEGDHRTETLSVELGKSQSTQYSKEGGPEKSLQVVSSNHLPKDGGVPEKVSTHIRGVDEIETNVSYLYGRTLESITLRMTI